MGQRVAKGMAHVPLGDRAHDPLADWPWSAAARGGHSGRSRRRSGLDEGSKKFRCQSMGPDPMCRCSVTVLRTIAMTISDEAYVRSSKKGQVRTFEKRGGSVRR